MKKYYLIFSMVLAVSLSCSFAQTVSSQKGLTTTIFNLPAGIIKVYLPDDISPGDVISGAIIAKAAGGNKKEIAKNLADLKNTW